MTVVVWKPVPGFGGFYEASDMGDIRTVERVVTKLHRSGKTIQQKYKSRILKPSRSDKYGHMVVHIGFDGKTCNVAVHRLVLLAFTGEPSAGQEACHNNGNASDNRVSNLRWDSHLSNNQDRRKHGNYAIGALHPMAKLTPEIVREIRASGLNGPQVSKRFGIGTSHAHRILSNKSWIGI